MKLILLLITLATAVECSRVLMILPLGSASHKNIMTPMAEALGSRGHQVTIASLHASSSNASKSYIDLVAANAWNTIKKVTGEFDVFKMREGGKDVNSQVMKKVLRHLPEYCDAFLRDPGVQAAWNTKPDLILLPAFMNECGLALVHKFKVPFMYVTTSGLTPWTADLLGNPEHPAYVPNQYLSYGDHMNLWERTVNTLVRFITPYLRRNFVLNRVEGVVQKFLGDQTVSMSDLERNVSMVLVNSHYSLGHPRPLLPNVVEVGGMHCRDPRPIQDPELKHFLDSSPVPVVFFSLGSSIRSEQLPDALRHALVTAFSRLPYRIVWKWEGAAINDLPANVLTRSWMPQQDLLGHQNVKAFLTHGGLLSMQEAVYHNVPIVGLPLMSDQHLNVRQAVTLGLGRELTLEKLTSDAITKAIMAVIEDDTYRLEVQKRSMLFRDQETSSLDRAIYWIEHVLRHGGASHLRSAAANMPLHQYMLLDVAAVLLASSIILLLLLKWILMATARSLRVCLRKVAGKVLKLVQTHSKTM
ncbi:UDP-glucuronosyltransferase 2A1 [Halocaridina rubra]|uniref:UDP-glucuronosyltransferase n=1 Tax=Halocaridina rubra TaxID=373956 RepID=A0AAN9A614_HALRR